MSDPLLRRIPVVGGLGYVEHVRRLPPEFSTTLRAEPDNRHLPHAIAVLVDGQKVGYVAPEIARSYFEQVKNREVDFRTYPGRRASRSDHETSGVELLLDFSGVFNG
jgi:hypothetical protein